MLNNIRIFLVFAFMLPVIGVRADDGRSFSRQMNDIKRSGDYIYAESSAPTEADAKTACDALLKIEITKYLVSIDSQSHAGGRIIKDITDFNCEYLVQTRGDMIRVFGYVNKGNISSPEKKNTENLPAVPTAPTHTETATTDIPATDPPSRPTAANLKADGLQLAKWQLDMLENIVSQPDMTQAKKLLNRYKHQNRIKRLGDSTISNPRPADSFYLIYNGSDMPVALLAPSMTGSHYDMLSGATVNLENYNGNQYLWFQISK